jgi:hypothetical protein
MLQGTNYILCCDYCFTILDRNNRTKLITNLARELQPEPGGSSPVNADSKNVIASNMPSEVHTRLIMGTDIFTSHDQKLNVICVMIFKMKMLTL